MSSNSANPAEDPSSSSNITQSPLRPFVPPINGTPTSIGKARALRARPSESGSLPLALPSPKTPLPTPVSVRAPTPKEFNQISRRLGDENIREKREELLVEKEKQLKILLDGHDDAIREQFHLERFVTMITGWDPKAAKVDNSPVFLEWKEQRHNLLSLLPPSASLPSGSASAGPSRHPSSVPARTTRRQAHEQSEILTQVVTPAALPMVRQISPTKFVLKVNGASSSSATVSEKAKGKRRASDVLIEEVQVAEETPLKGKGGRKSRQSVSTAEMPPPPLPTQAQKGKSSRRTTMGGSAEAVAAEVEVKEEIQDPGGGGGKGKKRSRQSLPNLPAAKKTRQAQFSAEEQVASPSPVIEISTPREPSPPPAPTPAPLPSLAHLPFPPPPKRPIERLRGPRAIQYTDPSQKPPSSPQHDGHISPILESYIHLEDSGPMLDFKTLESRAAKDGYFRARVMYLQSHGRLQRLLDEAEDDQVSLIGSKNTSSNRSQSSKLPPRKTDYQDSLMAHMVQVRNAMLNEAKMKPVVCKRIARMIQIYWERIEGREERERLAEEKEKKRLGKELIKGLRKRWALAVKIVRAKLLEIQKIEQDRLGKEHLQNILQRSTGLLEAQVTGTELDGDGDEDSDDDVSDATEDVSAAEDSDEGEGLTEGEEGLPIESSLPPETPLEDEGEELESEEDENEDVSEDDGDGIQPDLRNLLGQDEEVDFNGQEEPTVNRDETISEKGEDSVNENDQVSPHSDKTSHLDINTISNGAHSSPSRIPSSSPDPLDLLTPHTPTLPEVNGHYSPQNSSTTISRSRRERKIKPPIPLPSGDDPDANDTEFTAANTSDVDDQDAELDVEMEDQDEGQERDSEDDGLLQDADVPIEELLKRYGYPVPGEQDVEVDDNDDHLPNGQAMRIDRGITQNKTKEDQEQSAKVNGNRADGEEQLGEPVATTTEVHVSTLANAHSSQEVATDKSLLDDRLPETPTSPQLIIEGKRQRRVRSVWSPDEKTPQHLSSNRRPKIEVVGDQEQESSPEPTSSEEEEESSDDEEENEEEGGKSMEVDEEGPRVRQPFLLRGTLRPYQQAGLEWLASLWENGMNGILADEMGLGKTIQTISLLGHLACDKGIWGQHLIIVPTSVILNWEMEFKKFLPGFKVLTYYGNQKERKEKRVGWLSETSWQVCITSYQIVLADQHIFRRKNWSYLILDEAHNIKNFRSQRWQTLLGFKASRRLLLTGTPLQNNLMELWSLLYFLMPGGIGADATAVVGFANHKEFMEWFSNPMDKAIETGDAMDEETLATVSKLHTLLRPFILRRLKSEVETQLPGKFEHVVYCKLSKRQRFLYDEFMSRSSTKEALTSGGYLGVMNTLMQLRKVCNHPDLFEVRPVRTSFAMDSVARDFEPQEILVRQRLLAQEDDSKVDIVSLCLGITANEQESGWVCRSRQALDASNKLPHAIEPVITRRGRLPAGPKKDTRTVEGWLKYQEWAQEQASILRWRSLRDVNRRRCSPQPIYGSTFLNILGYTPNYLLPLTSTPRKDEMFAEYRPPASVLISSLPDRAKTLEPIIDLFTVIPPNVVARNMSKYALPNLTPWSHPLLKEESFDTLHRSTVKLQIAFPDSSLLQYDCGKLQTLYTMLRDLKAGGHRVLIFTQMTRVLDILEIFLSYNGHRYLRLDGSTKIEDRQVITERFNSDPRYFVFIASSRSGGVGINLTGADTVFFYDSDWNPSMDRQCMDRAHRIGQTREVHIYRFVSSHTVEENMLKKAEQKRLLDKMVIQQGEFNNDWWGRVGWKDMFGDVNEQEVKEGKGGEDGVIDVDVEGTPTAEEITKLKPRAGQERELARVLAQVEDEEDVAAAKIAQNENELDFQEFDEMPSTGEGAKRHQPQKVSFDVEGSNTPITPQTPAFGQDGEEEGEVEGEYEDDGIGAIDEYMLKWVEEDWMTYFIGFRA
ncbi:hypothetical protein I203_103844 [Kwoniella mangroviensis CBS 8507]|uniref:uncharacterized protein n=1 Tax=Kwoniella mangroviensis CBS 8507 TaxID=1296122 RepID=UPI00080D2324|nr:uncharacterized protein I203_04062 [Kwoniella mangroviensis CBS 8507]OCF66486.1 hypothetical protein I203_04062 [Kwoniella mangroviensis CBS 8507]